MNFYDILLARALCCNGGEESGGSGSCDFSTAQVTIVTGSKSLDGGVVRIIAIDDRYDEIKTINMNAAEPGTYSVVLYKGKQVLDDVESIESVSGNITYDGEDEIYIITGDCTITIYQVSIT